MIEHKFKADKIEVNAHQGWSWNEFDLYNESAPNYERIKIEREALALLAALVQHADNKDEQQRLICLDKDIPENAATCDQPAMMIQDLGFSFGHGFTDGKQGFDKMGTANLKGFLEAPIWSDAEQCITQINFYKYTGQKANKKISEKARIFLSDRLNSLSDDDLINLFTVSKIYRLDEYLLDDNGDPKKVQIMDWVNGFKQKIKKITEHTCPE
ncbi:MAG: hypothetical protein D3906_02475 [Candidatus Electrothrix sp. AUS1_2]|nr:hypothetical protein [Candidatus Electrothrix sp. AUS1_2]